MRARIFSQGTAEDVYRAVERIIVAALIALPIEGASLAQQIPATVARMSARNIVGRLAEQFCGLQIAALGQRDVALGGGRTRRAEHLRVLGGLRLLLELAGFLSRRDLGLRRLAQ